MTEALAEVYEKMSFDDVCTLIREKQANMALNYVAIGFFLRKAKERELYVKGNYKNIFEMANEEFGMARQTAEHCMRVNEKFSEDGYSPKLAKPYREYGKSQLQEMLYLTDEQLEDVRPDMTVKDIRNIRKPVEEPVEAPETKLERAEAGRKPTEEEREILDELARRLIYKYKEWMLADFHVRVMDVMTSYQALREQMKKGESYTIWFSGRAGAYHANLFKKYVQLWEEHDGCLGNIETFYLAAAIQAMWNKIALEDARKKAEQTKVESEKCSTSSREPEEQPEEQIFSQDFIEEHPEWLPEGYEKQPIIEGEFREVQQEEKTEECSTSSMAEEELSDLDILKDKLEREKRLLGIALNTVGAEDRCTRGQKLVVSALAEMPAEEPVQPELPVLKNNEQRKEWLRNYKDWGLWYEDKHIGAKYYKYNFQNGACLIAEIYERKICGNLYESSYLHLIGAPKEGTNKWAVHEQYNRYPNSETELVEFLKAVQKNR